MGFFVVLLSEILVFMLIVIIIECYIVIMYVLDIIKKMSLKKMYFVMFVGWCFVFIVVILLLFGVSDYIKFSVCLLFEIGNMKFLVYVILVFILNGLVFIVILICYCRIYSVICGLNVWNINDLRIVLRMVIFIFIDFLCWVFIIVFFFIVVFGGEYVSFKDVKIFIVFVFFFNSCVNFFLYVIFIV